MGDVADLAQARRLPAVAEIEARAVPISRAAKLEELRTIVRSALAEERLVGGIIAAGDARRRAEPQDLETERRVVGAAVAGEVEVFLLDDLLEEDFSNELPGTSLYWMVLQHLRAGARGVQELIAAFEGDGHCGPIIRVEIEDLEMLPVDSMTGVGRRIDRLKELARRRRIRTLLKQIVLRLELDDLTADGAIVALSTAGGAE